MIDLAQMKAATAPGCCPFCGDPQAPKKTKPHLTCGSIECKRAYQRLHKRLSRKRQAERLKTGPKGPVVAVCNTRPSSVTSDPEGDAVGVA